MTLRTEAGDKRHGQRAAQIARADRLAGGEIGLDDALEDLARALVELAQANGAVAHGSKGIDVGVTHDARNLGTGTRSVKCRSRPSSA